MKLKKINLKEHYEFVEKRLQERLKYKSIKIQLKEECKGITTEHAEKFYEKYGKGENIRLVLEFSKSKQTFFVEDGVVSFQNVRDVDAFDEANLTDTFNETHEDTIMSRQDKISRILKIEQHLTSKVINGRGDGSYRPAVGDEDQPLRDEVAKLREEVFGTKKEKSEPTKEIILKNSQERKGPTASVSAD